MAEVEHFVDPESGKEHPKFAEIKDVELPLLDRNTQLSGKTTLRSMSIAKAVSEKVIDNETLGYFLARILSFLLKIGVDPSKIRFRQHMANDMAHYACDCWDAELQTSYGWIECVGCADRSAYDLTVHMKRTGESLVVEEVRPQPLQITEWQASFNKQVLGKTFKEHAKAIENAVTSLTQDELANLATELDSQDKIEVSVTGMSDGGSKTTLGKDTVTIAQVTRTENVREYTSNVIEPSFGIG